VFYNLCDFAQCLQEDKENATTAAVNVPPVFFVDFSLDVRELLTLMQQSNTITDTNTTFAVSGLINDAALMVSRVIIFQNKP
jgi:hypothetical protein